MVDGLEPAGFGAINHQLSTISQEEASEQLGEAFERAGRDGMDNQLRPGPVAFASQAPRRVVDVLLPALRAGPFGGSGHVPLAAPVRTGTNGGPCRSERGLSEVS